HGLLFWQPAFGCDADPEPQILETLGAMGVRIDYALNPFLFRQRPPAPVEIEAFRRGIELNPGAGARRGVENYRDINLVRVALQEQATSRMRQHGDEPTL